MSTVTLSCSGRDLVKHLGQHGGVADVAGGKHRHLNFQRLLVGPDLDLPRDAPLGNAMFKLVALAFILDLVAGAVELQLQQPLLSQNGMLILMSACRRDEVPKFDAV